MSLEALRAMRMRRQKPAGVVEIFFRTPPRYWLDEPTQIFVRPADQPEFMDWRPMIGLWVALYSRDADVPRMSKAIAALEALNCKFFGAVCDSFVLPMTVDPTPRHSELLAESWSLLCK